MSRKVFSKIHENAVLPKYKKFFLSLPGASRKKKRWEKFVGAEDILSRFFEAKTRSTASMKILKTCVCSNEIF